MSVLVDRAVVFERLIADLRHMQARAASDLVDWLVHLEARGMADRTIYSYHRTVAKLLREFPEKELGEFTDTNIERILSLTPRQSRHITQSILNQFFVWARKKRRIVENPMDYVDRVRKLPRRPKDIFSEAEVAILEGLATPDGELFTILFGTGIRRGEARHLRRSDINLERQLLVVRKGKGDKGRVVAIPEEGKNVVAAVSDLDLYERLEPTDYLWYSLLGQGRYRVRRKPVSDSRIDNWYRRCIGSLDGTVRMLNLHQTRHTYAWLLREAGYDIEERQVLMGHESIATTQKYYGRLTVDDVAAKVRKVGI